MINSLCGSLKSDPTSLEINSSSKRVPPSLAASTVSESTSKAVASELDPVLTRDPSSLPPVDGLRFDLDDVGGEVQSPGKTTLWEALLLHEQMDGADFMISSPLRDFVMSSPRKDYVTSPRRDYMVSSPKRDDMVSSPRREYYMVSSPKREFMAGSPRREYSMLSSEKKDQFVMISSPRRTSVHPVCCHISYGCVHAGNYGQSLFVPPPCNPSLLGAGFSGHGTVHSHRGKPQSPLRKVYNCTSSTLYAAHAEDDVGVLDDYDDRDAYTAYPGMKAPAGADCLSEDFDVSSTLPSLPAMLDCLSVVPTSRLCGQAGETTLEGLQMPEEGDLFHMNPFETAPLAQSHEGHSLQENGLHETLLKGISNNSELVEPTSHGQLQGPVSAEAEQEQDGGLQIVHLLLACAEAVAKDDHMSTRRHLHHLNRVVSPLGDSMQRVAAFFTDALAARLARLAEAASKDGASPSTSPPPFPTLAAHTMDVLKIYQILYQACPYIKFAHFTANQAIFEAFESEKRVHIVDLDILQGYQWPDLMQALAARARGPPFLRVTGVGFPLRAVQETGRHLAELAHSLRIPFEFHPVGERLEDLLPHMLHRRVGEALAVNSVCRLHRVKGAQLGALLGMIRDQAPSVFTVVEQEASHNGPYFLGRFLEALHYYSAIFDSLDATFPADSEERAKVERYVFAPEIRNIVAYEGAERVERHEKLDKWKRVMEGKGFKGVPLSAHAMALSEMLLGLYPCDGYRLKEKNGCLLLGWQDRPLLAASAWRC